MNPSLYESLRKRLEALCPHRVLTAGHPRYDEVRGMFNGMHDRRPAVICLPADGAEIQAVVTAGREAGIPVTVRGGGHNVAGSGSNDNGLVIDLRLMRQVTVDPEHALARVQGGATWDDVDAAAAEHGLATTGGTVGSTGVAGLTLGGGLGYLSRSLGLTCDRVRSYRTVTGDGQRRQVDADHDPQLNRLLRGAGHGLGVVEEFTFRLAPVSRVYGGRFAYSLRHAAPVLAAFGDLMADAPPELTCLLMLEPWGDPPARSVVANVFYSGGDQRVVDRIRSTMGGCAPLTGLDFAPRSYLSMQASLGETDFGLRHYWTTCSLSALPGDLAEGLVEQYARGGCGDGVDDTIIITPLGGAVSTPAEPGAISFRDAAYTVLSMAIWRDPAQDDARREWARGVTRLARPWSLGGDGHVDYVNYASDPVDRHRPDGLSDETSRALREVRARVDPDGVFTPVLPAAPALPAPATA
ncbi:FAD-binding oxidoreductase [Streptomyces sp. NPDC126933]|uniref:FAD-binding oxidoreductase n=1 Tax=unclassified Streptomyces TaxID=2593676 RepID=UPI0036511DA8